MNANKTCPVVCTEEGASERHLYTVAQFAQKHPAFSIEGLRWLLFHRKSNGLERAVLRVGKRVLLDEKLFFDWLDEHNDPSI